jgi:broad specificity phosphatase PhoE
MKITFTRHGESQANILREISNRGLKHPLTPTGRKQAAELANTLQEQAVTRIYSSPVLRAIETTVILAERLDVDYEVVEALREYDVGELEGRSDAQAWLAMEELGKTWLYQGRFDERLPGGESFNDLRKRFLPFIEGLIQEYGKGTAHLVCVAHGGVYWMMLPLVLGNVDLALIHKQGGFGHTDCISTELTANGLVCTAWNGVLVESG